MVATSVAESRKDGRAWSILDRQVAAFDELRDHEAEPIFRATHVMDRHDMRMIQPGEDSSFGQISLDILGASDPLRVRHLDGNRTIKIVIMTKIDPPESTLTETPDDPVTPDLLAIAVRGAFRSLIRRLRAFGIGEVFRLIHRSFPDNDRSFR